MWAMVICQILLVCSKTVNHDYVAAVCMHTSKYHNSKVLRACRPCCTCNASNLFCTADCTVCRPEWQQHCSVDDLMLVHGLQQLLALLHEIFLAETWKCIIGGIRLELVHDLHHELECFDDVVFAFL